MNRYEQQLASYATQVNDALRERLHFDRELRQIVVVDAMRHSLLDAGKRLRAAMVLEFGRLTHASREGAMALACAIEMIHAYSLIHDDLPCMDDDDTRRGRPSCHRAYGEATALLAGDALLTAAFETLACAGQSAQAQNVQAVGVLAAAAGARGMVRGQELDLYYEAVPAGEAQLREVHRNKTGMLMAAAAQLGAIAAGAPQVQQGALRDFAFSVGLVFQMVDDVLDVVSTTQELGKPVGSDAHNGKTTFVTLHGVEGTRALAVRTTADACDALAANFGEAAAFLCAFAQSLISRTM